MNINRKTLHRSTSVARGGGSVERLFVGCRSWLGVAWRRTLKNTLKLYIRIYIIYLIYYVCVETTERQNRTTLCLTFLPLYGTKLVLVHSSQVIRLIGNRPHNVFHSNSPYSRYQVAFVEYCGVFCWVKNCTIVFLFFGPCVVVRWSWCGRAWERESRGASCSFSPVGGSARTSYICGIYVYAEKITSVTDRFSNVTGISVIVSMLYLCYIYIMMHAWYGVRSSHRHTQQHSLTRLESWG